MSHTKKRKRSHHPNHPPVSPIKKKIRKIRIISVAVIFLMIFGAGIAFFAAGSNPVWLTVGALIGGVGGYFFGKQIVNGLLKK
ncbi:MAG: hypothetical protein KGM98_14625 [Bacteroidota bacterium]|nr:hypothetical protein [Bacteroidota bacterium]